MPPFLSIFTLFGLFQRVIAGGFQIDAMIIGDALRQLKNLPQFFSASKP
jgi:hypothetical protein